ncbi:MAG: hypothetical protein ACKVT2_13330 [Saprospiraceae bacterium]
MNTSQQRDPTLGTAHLVYNAIGRSEDIKKPARATLSEHPPARSDGHGRTWQNYLRSNVLADLYQAVDFMRRAVAIF